MGFSASTNHERIQGMAAEILATHPVGHRLCLIGGYRYRLLDASPRASVDIDYHWEGDLAAKQGEIAAVLRGRLLPEVKRRLAYEGDVRPADSPAAASPAVRVIKAAFYRSAERGSRIEIPFEVTRIPCLDAPIVRTISGTVFLTVSDADMVEGKAESVIRRISP